MDNKFEAGSKTTELFEKLDLLDPADVCLRAGCSFDPASNDNGIDKGIFTVPFFSSKIEVDTLGRTVRSSLLDEVELGPFTNKYVNDWVLFYLLLANKIGRKESWVHPNELKEGKFFFHGSHELPLEKFSQEFNSDPELLRKKGAALGKLRTDIAGDICIELVPLPRVPVLIVFWLGDEDFEPSTSFLFDGSVNDHLAIDILWGLAHLSLEMLTKVKA